MSYSLIGLKPFHKGLSKVTTVIPVHGVLSSSVKWEFSSESLNDLCDIYVGIALFGVSNSFKRYANWVLVTVSTICL